MSNTRYQAPWDTLITHGAGKGKIPHHFVDKSARLYDLPAAYYGHRSGHTYVRSTKWCGIKLLPNNGFSGYYSQITLI